MTCLTLLAGTTGFSYATSNSGQYVFGNISFAEDVLRTIHENDKLSIYDPENQTALLSTVIPGAFFAALLFVSNFATYYDEVIKRHKKSDESVPLLPQEPSTRSQKTLKVIKEGSDYLAAGYKALQMALSTYLLFKKCGWGNYGSAIIPALLFPGNAIAQVALFRGNATSKESLENYNCRVYYATDSYGINASGMYEYTLVRFVEYCLKKANDTGNLNVEIPVYAIGGVFAVCLSIANHLTYIPKIRKYYGMAEETLTATVGKKTVDAFGAVFKSANMTFSTILLITPYTEALEIIIPISAVLFTFNLYSQWVLFNNKYKKSSLASHSLVVNRLPRSDSNGSIAVPIQNYDPVFPTSVYA